jgi:hypothetical protein
VLPLRIVTNSGSLLSHHDLRVERAKAIVLCVDEKPSIQALERAQGYLKLPNGMEIESTHVIGGGLPGRGPSGRPRADPGAAARMDEIVLRLKVLDDDRRGGLEGAPGGRPQISRQGRRANDALLPQPTLVRR